MGADPDPVNVEDVTNTIRLAAVNESLMKHRSELARHTAETFGAVGTEHLVGNDRVAGASPFGHGSDETVAVSR